MKEKVILGLSITAVIAGFVLTQIHENRRMERYAKVNSCKWYATGTWYGDDRDFICIKKGVK